MKSIFQINKTLLPMKIHYFVGIAGTAPIVPFLSTMSRQRGYSPVIVGLIFMMLPMPGLLLRPVVGALTDKYKCRRTVLTLNAVLMGLMVCALWLIPGAAVDRQLDDLDVIRSSLFWLFAAVVMLLFTGNIVRSVLEDTICFSLLGDEKHKYGQQRVWGAIGWGTMSLVSGVCVDWYSKGQPHKDYTPSFVISAACLFIDAYVVSTIKAVQNTDNKIVVSDVGKLFKKAKVLVFLFWIVAFGFFCSFVWNYVFWYMEDLANIYHPETKPWIKTIQGLSLTIQCFGGEVPFFFLSSVVLKRVDHMNVLSLMFFTFSARFFLYSLIRNPVWILPVELLNGITFALAYATAVSYAAHLAPVGAEGTLQGIVGMAQMGIGSPIGNAFGGYLFQHYHSNVAFEILSGVALTICLVQMVVNQLVIRLSKKRESQ